MERASTLAPIMGVKTVFMDMARITFSMAVVNAQLLRAFLISPFAKVRDSDQHLICCFSCLPMRLRGSCVGYATNL
jgi:hypothetical protein